MNNFFMIGSKIVYYAANKGFLNFIDDKEYLKLLYFFRFRKKLDFDNVKTYNEKLQWLKIYDRNPNYTNMVDKYEVREYIKNKIGNEYLIPLYGVYNNIEEINIDKLPNKFVLKVTHDSGGVIICKDKMKFDCERAKEKINKLMKNNYYYKWREWPYKNITPRIICEEYMIDNTSSDLRDYKFMCFNGKVKCSFVCTERDRKNGLKVDFFDADWNRMDFKRVYENSDKYIPKPKNYEKMIELAEILASGTDFLRVDFYEINEKIYFGELTFYPGSGFESFTPNIYDDLLGEWLILSNGENK